MNIKKTILLLIFLPLLLNSGENVDSLKNEIEKYKLEKE